MDFGIHYALKIVEKSDAIRRFGPKRCLRSCMSDTASKPVEGKPSSALISQQFLPRKVGEGFVRFRHLVYILALLDGLAFVL